MNVICKKILFRTFFMALLATGMCVADSAYAGFNFVPSPEKNLQTPQSSMTHAMESDSIDSTASSPMPNATVKETPLITNKPDPQKIQGISSRNKNIPIAEKVARLDSRPVLDNALSFEGDVVHGFGSDMPLVLAVQQIVPPQFGFAFGNAVDLGMRVDWNGGQPWNRILSDMGNTYGFNVRIKNNTVYIGQPGMGRDLSYETSPSYPPSLVQDDMYSLPNENRTPNTGQQALKPIQLDSLMTSDPNTVENRDSFSSPDPSSKGEKRILVKKDNGKIKEIVSKPGASDYNAIVKLENEESIQWATEEPYEELSFDQNLVLNETATPVTNMPPPLEIAASQPVTLSANDLRSPQAGNAWTADKGETLRSVLQRWAGKEDISLVWLSEYDYPLEADVYIGGSFEHAIKEILVGFAHASPRPMGRLHTNHTAGEPVLVIRSERITK